MAYESLQYEVRDHVAYITLNRPEQGNALNVAMARELLQVSVACSQDPQVRAVLLRGHGKMFCAGGDVKLFASAGDGLPAAVSELIVYLHGAISRFARMDAPLIAAVHSVAAGAGMSLACAADLVVAAESATFVMAYTRIGLAPDGSSSFFLPRIVGMRRAQELMLTNRTLSAREALEWNVVTRVVADDALADEAEKLARTMADGPTRAYGSVKKLLLTTMSEGLETQMEYESQYITACAAGPESREGIRAFVEKRPAKFHKS